MTSYPLGPEDPEQRIADLQRQLAAVRRIANLEGQLSKAPSAVTPELRDANLTVEALLDDGHSPPIPLDDRLRSKRWRSSATPSAPPDANLTAAPRKIPASFVLAEVLPFRWWYVFALFLVTVSPISLWQSHPQSAGVAAIVTVAAVYAYHFCGTRKRMALLKLGQVATVTGTEFISRGSYYSGVTWFNAPLPIANGWTVTRPLYSGPGTTTRLGYSVGGHEGQIKVSGREYVDGVVLADQRHPERALCVTSFSYDLDRDDSGNWVGKLRGRLKLGMAAWFIILVCWVSLGAVADELLEVKISPGGSASVYDHDTSKTVYCNGGHLSVDGSTVTVTVVGHCATLTVNGIDNAVAVDSADTIVAQGINSHVTYHSGAPKIVKGGINSTVTRG
jgi:hypothetical protein